MTPEPLLKQMTRPLLLVASLALVSTPALAHPGRKPHGPGVKPHTAHPQPQPHEACKIHQRRAPQEQIDKRLATIKKLHKARRGATAKHREARRTEIRRTLRAALKGTRLDKQARKMVTNKLRVHGKRLARLRRIQFIAAENDDFDTVEKVTKIIARENARYAAWMRNAPRLAAAEKANTKSGAQP